VSAGVGPGRQRQTRQARPAPRSPDRLPEPLTLSPSIAGASGPPHPATSERAGNRKRLRPGLPSNRRPGAGSRSAERWMSAAARRRTAFWEREGWRRVMAAGWRRAPSSAIRAGSGSSGCLCGCRGGLLPEPVLSWVLSGGGAAEHRPVRRGRGAHPGSLQSSAVSLLSAGLYRPKCTAKTFRIVAGALVVKPCAITVEKKG